MAVAQYAGTKAPQKQEGVQHQCKLLLDVAHETGCAAHPCTMEQDVRLLGSAAPLLGELNRG